MPSKVHIIDPIADTLLILKNPCKNFASWDETTIRSIAETPTSEKQQIVQVETSEDEVILEQKELFASDAETSEVEDVDEIHYLVSSRHLMLASPWFMRTLTKEAYKESVKDTSDNLYHIVAEDWDETAFLILLNIFHIRTRQVPATMSLEMLAKIAVLVDYYELIDAEVMEREVNNWITDVKLHDPVPTTYCRELILWIFVSQVFSIDDEFKGATAIAAELCQGSVDTLGLPIHDKIISEIEGLRCKAIDYFFLGLRSLLLSYEDFDYDCPFDQDLSFQCGIFLYGALMKHMRKWNFFPMVPQTPFPGISFADLKIKSEQVGELGWVQEGSYYRGRPSYQPHPCRLGLEIERIIEQAASILTGLKLQSS